MITILVADTAAEMAPFKDYIANALGCNTISDFEFETSGLKSLRDFIANGKHLGRKALVLTCLEVPDEWVEIPGVAAIWGWEDFVNEHGLPARKEPEVPTAGSPCLNTCDVDDAHDIDPVLPKEALFTLAKSAVLAYKSAFGTPAARVFLKNQGLNSIQDLKTLHPYFAADALARALYSQMAPADTESLTFQQLLYAKVFSGKRLVEEGTPPQTKPEPERIPVSLIDSSATELSEAKQRIHDLVMQLDKKDEDLSSLLQSNRELSANNARCKEEINLLNGEIRKMQETNDYGVAGYELLAKVLQGAYNQAALGKGKERHANDLPFHEQKMLSITHQLGSPIGLAYQVIKKVEEALGLPTVERQVSELYGAINYTAGIIIYLESRQPTEMEGQR